MYTTLHQKKEYIDKDFDKLAEQIGDVPKDSKEQDEWWHQTIETLNAWFKRYEHKSMEGYAKEVMFDYVHTLECVTSALRYKKNGQDI